MKPRTKIERDLCKLLRKQKRESPSSASITMVTTRFNSITWKQNEEYRLKNGIVCVYSVPTPIKSSIFLNSILFVLEMNNTLNRIEGIGLVRNHPYYNIDKEEKGYKHAIYEYSRFNRYYYIGNHRLSREDIPSLLLNQLECLCFKGYTHLKRGTGITELSDVLWDSWLFVQQNERENEREKIKEEYNQEFGRECAKNAKEMLKFLFSQTKEKSSRV
jgi:hypothetical protein